jgi:hypothetical protein
MPICHDRRQTPTIRGAYLDDDASAHAADSHPRAKSRLISRSLPSASL